MKIFKQRNVVKAVEQELRKEVRQSNRSSGRRKAKSGQTGMSSCVLDYDE
jgi:hypothetical protein